MSLSATEVARSSWPAGVSLNPNDFNEMLKTATITALPVTGGVLAAVSGVNVNVDGGQTLTKAGTISGGAGSVYATRGLVTISSGTTIKEMFVAGVRAGVVVAGTVTEDSATRVCALFAKLDVSAATLTSGQISAAWFDWGASASTPASGECNVIRVQNTTAAVLNSLIYGYGKATFGFDLSDNGAGWIAAVAPSTLSGSIKVNVNGTTRYIALYTNAS